MPPRAPKLQRWTDLIAALLKRRYPATFEEIADDVPAYSHRSKKSDAVMRMFERDKDELRAFGIAIETIPFEDDDGDASGYKLDRRNFYLPFLSLSARDGPPAAAIRRPTKSGYRALASLVMEPDELAMIARAAERVRSLGDPVLADEAESAIRKLSFDLPLPQTEENQGAQKSAVDDSVFTELSDALARRKTITFRYLSMGSGTSSERSVEPYGLFFLSSHWYLAARDIDRSELRNFRLSRMSDVSVNQARAQSPDYTIPDAFDLRAHARSRHAWEMGDDAGRDAIVEFRNPTGAARAASRLGIAVEGPGDRRRFQFRRTDSFARWLLSFGGEAIPLEPPELVAEFDAQVRGTAELYA
jgi:proteasome accessory factor B